MIISIDTLIEMAGTLAIAGISLFWALSLTHQFPWRKAGSFFLLWFLWGSVLVGFELFSLTYLWRFLLPPFLIIGIWLLWGTFLYAAAAGLLASVLLELGKLLWIVGLPMPTVLLIGAGLAFLCSWLKIVILPELGEFLTIGSKEQTRKFNFSILLMVLTLLVIQIWQGFLLLMIPEFSDFSEICLVIFTFTIVALLVAYMRHIAFDAMQRIEALIDKQYQAELLNLMQIIRSQRHDFNFHIQTISGLIENRKYEDCDNYIRQMVTSTSRMNALLPLQSPAVSAMLNSFQEIATQRGIDLDIAIHDSLSDLPCTVYEINTIIGNLIQNAIDEVSESKQKHIQIMTLRRGGNHIIKVTNPVREDIELRDLFKPGYTTKQSHEGIGLATVEKLVSKHHGSVYPELQGNSISFIVRIPCIYSEI